MIWLHRGPGMQSKHCPRWAKMRKEICVNYFASILLGSVPEAANNFLCIIVSMTLIATHWIRLWKYSWNKINKDWVVQSLYFNAMSLDFWDLAINQWLRALLARQVVCKLTKIVVWKAVNFPVLLFRHSYWPSFWKLPRILVVSQGANHMVEVALVKTNR